MESYEIHNSRQRIRVVKGLDDRACDATRGADVKSEDDPCIANVERAIVV